MAQYQYDESGQSGFFVITFLVLTVLPWTYSVFSKLFFGSDKLTDRIPPPCKGWNAKDPQYASTKRTRKFKLSYLFLLLAWALLFYVSWQVASIENTQQVYDPFSILGLSSSSDEKAIKRHYKRLSVKFHPDKLKLEGNQTKEEVEAHFVELTKAYKSLTDETTRRNYELYGHPDGKQEMSMGIALPKWIVESQNNVYVLGIYGIIFGICLPYFVGRWWYGSRKFTKDGILTTSAATAFIGLKDDSSISDMIAILANGSEFQEDEFTKKFSKQKQNLDDLEVEVQDSLASLDLPQIDPDHFKTLANKQAAVLIYSHLLRLPLSDNLLVERQNVIFKAHHLVVALINTATARNWLPSLYNCIKLQQSLFQGLHPSLAPVLQLPFLSKHDAQLIEQDQNVRSVPDLVNAILKSDNPSQIKKDCFQDISDQQYDEMFQVAKHWPMLKVVDANFKVAGEKVVSPGSIVQLIVRVKLDYPGSSSEDETQDDPQKNLLDEDDALEMELINGPHKKAEGRNGEVKTGWAHGPRFPHNRRPSWYLFVGDKKLDKIFVPPQRFVDIGPSRVRTLRLQFQAPQQPGLYTFNTQLISDSYMGTDLTIPMQLKIEAPPAPTPDADDNDDDISDPEEGTLAGAMAEIGGKPYKRAGDQPASLKKQEDEDDSSSSSDESDLDDSDDDSSDDSSSDSDSD